MTDPRHRPTGDAQMAALGGAIPGDAFVAAPEVALTVRGFRFTPDMLAGWQPGRARMVETPRGVRLAQVNLTDPASGGLARLEVMEAPTAAQARPLFLETLARFQVDAAGAVLVPPPLGEAMAEPGGRALVFLRGNLVVALSGLGPQEMPLRALAATLDAALTAVPEVTEEAPVPAEAVAAARAATPAAVPMVKFLHRRGTPAAQRACYAIAPDGTARRVLPVDGEGEG